MPGCTAREGSFWVGKRVLVTGAGGFIGSHLVERLVHEGASVRAFVHYNSRADWGLLEWLAPDILSSIEIAFGDLKDPDAVRTVIEGREVVFHLGALIAIPYSYKNPVDVVQANLIGTLNVLTASRSTKVERMVQVSTSEVYGTARYAPIDEEHPLHGQSPYSASKIGADKLAESFYCSFDLPVVTLRPFNTYGPRQSARAVIPTIITQALTSDVVRLGALSPTRDLTFVHDTVRGFLLAGSVSGIEGETINLGTGQEVSIGGLAERIIALVGRSVTLEADPARLRPEKSEVLRLIADNRKAALRLGWTPTVSLDEGLELTIEAVRGSLSRYKPAVYNV
ncbi:MAG: GDP-mannose 4,6-dehydratase [Chloroflexota bacterium]|nr:GDP-mannose 4,6-dehydratase [Chloroflexota bacterium]